MLAPWNNNYEKPRQYIKKQRHYFADKSPYGQSYGFSSSHVWMWELDHKEGWALKNWHFKLWWGRRLLRVTWTVRRSNSLTPLGVNPKGNQPWINPDAEAEAPILWSPDAKNWLIGKDPDAEKDWGQEEKRVTEDEMVRWHHWLNGHEFEQTQGDAEGQRNLKCRSLWGRKQLDTT